MLPCISRKLKILGGASDWQVGVSVVDRFTYYTLQFFEDLDIHSNATIHRFGFIRLSCHANPECMADLNSGPLA